MRFLSFFGGDKEFTSLDSLVKYRVSQMKSRGKEDVPVRTDLTFRNRSSKPKTNFEDKIVNYFIDKDIVFKTEGLETLKLKAFRPIGYMEVEGSREVINALKLKLQSEFSDFSYQHQKLLLAETYKQAIYIHSVLVTSDPSLEPNFESSNKRINEAIKAIDSYKAINPAYNFRIAMDKAGKFNYGRSNRLNIKKEDFPSLEPSDDLEQRLKGENVLVFESVPAVAEYMGPRLINRGSETNLNATVLDSVLTEGVKDDTYFFGVKFEIKIDIDNDVAIFKGERPIGYWGGANPAEFYARTSDTIVRARYAELAHAYAVLIHYDIVQQIQNLVSIANRNLRGQFSLHRGENLKDKGNPIIQSLQRNSGLYTPVISFQNFNLPGHQNYSQKN